MSFSKMGTWKFRAQGSALRVAQGDPRIFGDYARDSIEDMSTNAHFIRKPFLRR